MKTIKVIFTQIKQNPPYPKAYSFNTTLDVKVGDLLKTPYYEGKLLQVVEIEEETLYFVSFKSGETTKEPTPGCVPIKTLGDLDTVIVEEKEEVCEGF